MAYQTVAYTINLPLDIYVVDSVNASTTLPITVNIVEPILAIEPLEIQVGTSVSLTPVEYGLSQTLHQLATALVRDKITTAFDTDIEMKMLLNLRLSNLKLFHHRNCLVQCLMFSYKIRIELIRLSHLLMSN